MKRAERNLLSLIFSGVPNSVLCALSRMELIIPYYHMISDVEVPHVKHLYRHKDVRRFQSDLDYLLRHYRPASLPDLVRESRAGKISPRKAFLLTFDDGFREMHDVVAPILRRKGIPATFFLSSGFIDNQDLCYKNKASLLVEEIHRIRSGALLKKTASVFGADPDRIPELAETILNVGYGGKELIDRALRAIEFDLDGYLKEARPYLSTGQIGSLLKDGFHIGAHSIDHPLYADLPLEEQIRQTLDSVREIRQAFRLDYGVFAFPHSDRNVTGQFYEEIHKDRKVDISFGTGGLKNDLGSRHLQRFSMEKPLHGARRILGYHYARAIFRNPM
jgi:peptidoglycan/xylan/chitin deacetylase (PgdA/CDA1 family)